MSNGLCRVDSHSTKKSSGFPELKYNLISIWRSSLLNLVLRYPNLVLWYPNLVIRYVFFCAVCVHLYYLDYLLLFVPFVFLCMICILACLGLDCVGLDCVWFGWVDLDWIGFRIATKEQNRIRYVQRNNYNNS